jgi:hypothetical protein
MRRALPPGVLSPQQEPPQRPGSGPYL